MNKLTRYGIYSLLGFGLVVGLTSIKDNTKHTFAENTTEIATEVVTEEATTEEVETQIDIVTSTENSIWERQKKAEYYKNMYGPKEHKVVTIDGYEIDYIKGAPASVYNEIARQMKLQEELESYENTYVEETYSYEGEAEPEYTPTTMTPVEGEASTDNMTFYTTATLTAYCWTGNPCADGVYPSVGYTVACNDPNLWHRWIYIEGLGTYFVHDTGGMPSYNIIDVYLGDYDSCINFGCQSANVYVLN